MNKTTKASRSEEQAVLTELRLIRKAVEETNSLLTMIWLKQQDADARADADDEELI